MIYVLEDDWKKIEESVGFRPVALFYHESNWKVCNPGDRMTRLSRITHDPRDACTVVFEHIHFEVVKHISKVKVRRKECRKEK